MTNGLEKGSTGSVVIPTLDRLAICDGDYVIEGIIADRFDLRALQKKYQVFRVVSVDDNRKGGSPHYKLGVAE